MRLTRLKTKKMNLSSGKGNVRRYLKSALALVCGTGLLFSAAACGPTQTPPSANVPEGPTIAIAVANDEPGLSLDHEGKYSGFDIEVAHYVAQKLGYAHKQIVFKPVNVSSAVNMLEESKADMVVSALPAVTASNTGRRFGTSKPYLTNPLGLMVPTRLQHDFTDTSSLKDRNVCTVKGTADGGELAAAIPAVKIQERDTYPQCLTALLVGEANAVAADTAILHGLASSVVEHDVTVLGDKDSASASASKLSNAIAKISPVRHAVMIRPSNGELTNKINTILADMVKDGTWQKAAKAMHKDIGYTPDSSLNHQVE
ncbi:transporter substrate-binding domain-containing protein [Bifidobacterium sp. ESL0728]|uniref:transporter substrate-binding domain-containing protein n=1 Tax=Bifidobacterium sp. ESL0728 TaxID=2983220 RepID=UPI0023FA1051|nr:transporter substrate-binding domain-containing protein [Bifidobacterium sp. ESL0728]WEV58268.1 transporter substrate-binding domain-containing protein [Bifidobacterium sp. ESL0728]